MEIEEKKKNPCVVVEKWFSLNLVDPRRKIFEKRKCQGKVYFEGFWIELSSNLVCCRGQ